MTEKVKDFIDALQKGDKISAGDAFKDALRAKVGDALDAHRKDVAGKMFNEPVEAQPHSDPKPEIATTGTFDKQGNVIPTGSGTADGSVDMDIASQPEPETVAQPEVGNDVQTPGQ